MTLLKIEIKFRSPPTGSFSSTNALEKMRVRGGIFPLMQRFLMPVLIHQPPNHRQTATG
jgi:hypothetical protein